MMRCANGGVLPLRMPRTPACGKFYKNGVEGLDSMRAEPFKNKIIYRLNYFNMNIFNF